MKLNDMTREEVLSWAKRMGDALGDGRWPEGGKMAVMRELDGLFREMWVAAGLEDPQVIIERRKKEAKHGS